MLPIRKLNLVKKSLAISESYIPPVHNYDVMTTKLHIYLVFCLFLGEKDFNKKTLLQAAFSLTLLFTLVVRFALVAHHLYQLYRLTTYTSLYHLYPFFFVFVCLCKACLIHIGNHCFIKYQ